MSGKLFDGLRRNALIYPRVVSSLQSLVEYGRLMVATCPHWDERMQQLAIAEMKFAHHWVSAGQIVYDLSHSLAAMFAITSSPPIDWRHAPHKTFVIKVPRRFLPIDGTIEPEYTYIFAHQDNTLLVSDYDTTASMLLQYNDETSRDGLELSDPTEIARRAQKAAAEMTPAQVDLQREANFQQIKRLKISDEQAHALARETTRFQIEQFQQFAAGAAKTRPKSIGQKVLVNRFLGNVMAYVNLHRPALSPSAKGVSRDAPLYANLLPPKELVIDRAFRDAAAAAVDAILEGSPVGIRRVLAHYVRGHWRDQPFGEGRSERKRIWIMPHLRGDESLGSVVRRVEHLNIPTGSN